MVKKKVLNTINMTIKPLCIKLAQKSGCAKYLMKIIIWTFWLKIGNLLEVYNKMWERIRHLMI